MSLRFWPENVGLRVGRQRKRCDSRDLAGKNYHSTKRICTAVIFTCTLFNLKVWTRTCLEAEGGDLHSVTAGTQRDSVRGCCSETLRCRLCLIPEDRSVRRHLSSRPSLLPHGLRPSQRHDVWQECPQPRGDFQTSGGFMRFSPETKLWVAVFAVAQHQMWLRLHLRLLVWSFYVVLKKTSHTFFFKLK